MIFKSSYPNAPDVSVVISGQSVDYTTIQKITVDVHENMHDLATITFTGLIPRGVTEYIGAPVYISIAINESRFTEFHGYVSFIEPVMETRKGLINDSPIQTAVMTCMGASFVMTQKKNRTWDNITVPQLVQKIADTYNYSFAVPSDTFTWKRLLQNYQSDWELLKNTCNSAGYYLTTSNTHIHVYDPFKVFARQMPYVELLTVRGALGDLQYAPGRIMEFRGVFGDITEDGEVFKYNYVGIDSAGTVVTSDTSSEDFTALGELYERKYTSEITTNVDSVEMLNRLTNSSTKRYYPFTATVKVTGVPDPVPGSVVKVDNYNSSFDGYWLVRGVRHEITRSNYLTELTIATDSTNGALPEQKPGAAFKTPPVPALRDDVWESSVAFEDIYA